MDDEKKEEELKKVNENEKSVEETKSESDVYIPEQLDDEDFEKEKEKIKAEKAAKKAEKKAKKQAEKAKKAGENADGDETKKVDHKKRKQRIVTIAIIVIIILFILIGVAGYLIYAINKPENAIEDFVSYVNEEDWNNAYNLIDMQGYMTMALIDYESQDDSNVSYSEFENKYDNVYNELNDIGYGQLQDVVEYGEENSVDLLQTLFTDTSFTVDSVDSVEKIGDTKLYKVTVELTIKDDTGSSSDSTDTYEMYVAKIDGKYKIVGGAFPAIIFYYYQYNYAYSSYYSGQ